MKIVRMLHPYCIPVFGYIAGGDEIGMPDNIADAMAAAGYAEYVELGPVIMSGGMPPIMSSGVPMYVAPVAAIEPPTEVPTESHKGKRKYWPPTTEEAAAEEN